ncbi:MAG: cupin domain-containing protein, partial [Pseudomonadota bacterium]
LEKPNHDTALKLIKNPSILWNAGIFVLGAHAAISAFETHATDLVVPIRDAVAAAEPDFGFLRLAPGPWAHAESISFDYAVMEHATDVYVLPFRSGWSDLGSWDAIWSESAKDKQGVVTQGEVIAEDCSSTLLRASKEMALIGVGLSDLIVIAEPDAVLVADRRQSNRVGEALLALAGTGKSQATEARRDYRPWGWFESLKVGEHFQVKHICVKPEGTLSLQSHQHRAEHWIVVQGIAEVTIDGVVSELRANQSIYVPLGAVHRLRNAGDVDMRLIEVQTGSYFGEDDITRFDDVYARQTEGT